MLSDADVRTCLDILILIDVPATRTGNTMTLEHIHTVDLLLHHHAGAQFARSADLDALGYIAGWKKEFGSRARGVTRRRTVMGLEYCRAEVDDWVNVSAVSYSLRAHARLLTVLPGSRLAGNHRTCQFVDPIPTPAVR